VRRFLKETKVKKWYKLFTSSKFIEDEFEADKQKVVAKYNDKGYRDARIVRDSVYRTGPGRLAIDLTVSEGRPYYFRNISWIGNTKYTSAQLSQWLGIKKGDVYSQKRLDEGLMGSASGRDITSLYMDDGYLFFQVNPAEVLVEGDSIDFEMRIYEGKQARISKVTVTGNTKTNDKVILREIRTRPGQLFSRSDIIRTQRELAQLGYFDPEKLNVSPKPDPANGTVDIEYIVEEKPSDQIELSGGWGAGQIVGTLGVSFNNFSARNLFRKGYWAPLPAGDGQRLSIRFVTNGKAYQSYNISFTEPWLGGRKPNALSVGYFHSVRNFSDVQSYKVDGVTVGLGKRLLWPDDFFSIYYSANYNYYTVNNYSGFIFSNGYSNNFNLGVAFSRNSVSQPIYPRSGSSHSISLQVTPPYSLFDNKDYTGATAQERYRFIEYHKWKLTSTWFTPLEPAKKLMLAVKMQYGMLGYYNGEIGQSPFERFFLGGDGLSGNFTLYGNDVIGMRGYEPSSLSPGAGAIAYAKYSLEVRYPITLNPNATLYGLGFLEAGNSWGRFRDFDPFNAKRSAGFGLRIFLPMFGLLGLDYGWPFDRSYDDPLNIEHGKPEFQFTLGQFF
jgi:outer membrane protein insertion porin family